jgi:tRNA (adenine37-N6)-methyltransferase
MNVEPVAWVHSLRARPEDDGWADITATITLDRSSYGPETLAGLAGFSHIEIVYLFDQVDPNAITLQVRHARDNPIWPVSGVFAQRGTVRPNRLGVSICRLEGVDGAALTVTGLDALDGTPVLNIKPVVVELGPRGPVRQPTWTHDFLAQYWTREP